MFLEASRRGVALTAPPPLREQMMVELMTPEALLAMVDHVLLLNEEDPAAPGHRRVVTFADELAVWEPVGQDP